jgi:outer membrane protein assembly factor BamB
VFVGVRDRSVVSIDVQTGAVAWTARTEATVDTSPAVEGGRVFAVSESASSGRARVYALDETTGRIEWTYSPGHVAIHVSSPTVDRGRVYVGMGDFRVVAFDAASGAVRWSSSVRGDFTSQSTAALSGGSLYIADQEGGLYRFDSQTGRRRWDYQFTSFMTRGSPLVIGNVVLQGLDNGTLAAVDVGEGHLVWRTRFTTGQVGPLTPAGRLLLAPVIGSKGGVYGLAHDPSAVLIDVPSPSHLDLAAAALNYAASFTVVLALVLLLFRLVLRRGRGMHDDPSRSASGAVTVDS